MDVWVWAIWLICILVSGISAYFDHKSRIIPNYLTIPFIILGYFVSFVQKQYLNIILSTILMLILFGYKKIGGGDTKLLGGIQLNLGNITILGINIPIIVSILTSAIIANIWKKNKKIALAPYILVGLLIEFILIIFK